MAGFSDSVSNVWVVRSGHGLDVEGFPSEIGAIDRLIRQALVRGGADMKPKIESAVAEALKHLDERDGPISEGE